MRPTSCETGILDVVEVFTDTVKGIRKRYELSRDSNIRIPCSAAESLSPRVTSGKVSALWEGKAVRD